MNTSVRDRRTLHAFKAAPFCKSPREKKQMRSLNRFFVLMVTSLALASLAQAQGTGAASPAVGAPSVSAAPESATKQEVNQLRSELAAQRQTIEELKALVEKLAGEKVATADSGGVKVLPAAAVIEGNSQ